MTTSFLALIENTIQGNIFTDEDLKIIFADKAIEQIHNSVAYHVKQSHIKRYKKGVYSLNTTKNRKIISKFSLANILYGPSYISHESALSYYGLIPEAVHETTSACFQIKKKNFKTPIGHFNFTQIPVRPFFLEVIKNEEEDFLIARPVRALFDLIYTQRRQYKKINDLEDDLRIDLQELSLMIKNYDASEIYHLGELYKKRTTSALSEILVRGFK